MPSEDFSAPWSYINCGVLKLFNKKLNLDTCVSLIRPATVQLKCRATNIAASKANVVVSACSFHSIAHSQSAHVWQGTTEQV